MHASCILNYMKMNVHKNNRANYAPNFKKSTRTTQKTIDVYYWCESVKKPLKALQTEAQMENWAEPGVVT